MSWQLTEQHSTQWLPPNSQNSAAYNGVLGYYWRIMWQIETKQNKTQKNQHHIQQNKTYGSW